jgi:beta-1,4-mannosyltransferase
MKVIIIPCNHEYITKLTEVLREKGVSVKWFNSFHYSTPANFLKTVVYRCLGYKIIHIHWTYVFPFNFLMKFYIKFAKLLGYKFVWTIHNIKSHEFTEKDIEKSRWLYNNVNYRFVHFKSNVKELKDTLQITNDKNLSVIYHPTFESVYPNTMSQEEARNKLGLSLDKKIALCFGQIRRYKGTDIFAQAFELLYQKGYEDYCGLVVGEVKDKDTIEKIGVIEKKVNNIRLITGYVPIGDVQLYLNACDIVVAPYREITTSGVLALAYAFSRPFISTNKGSISEMIENGKTGIILKENTAKAVSEAIIKIFNMDHKQMGKDAYVFSQKFTWTGVRDSTIDGYKEVLK